MELILVALNLTIWFYDRIFLPDTPERIEARNQKRLDNQELKQQQRRKKLEAQKAKLETQKAEIDEKLNK